MKRLRKALCMAFVAVLLLSAIPVPFASAGGEPFSTIAVGDNHFMAIKADGSLWGWGLNSYGTFGDGTLGIGPEREPFKIMENVSSVSAYDHTMIIKTDGSLWGCGWNKTGQIGDGTEPKDPYSLHYSATYVKVMEDVACVSADSTYTVAVKKDGTLWVTGDNRAGQLADGGKASRRHTFYKIMDDVAVVDGCSAIKKDGTLWGWGTNATGALANGLVAEDAIYKPQKIMDDVKAVSNGGLTHVLAIKNDGSLWGWGGNFVGVLGDSIPISEIKNPGQICTNIQTTPIKIMEDVSSVLAGDGYTFVIKPDGSLWGWGANDVGQLGDGTTVKRYTPAKVMDNVASVVGKGGKVMALKKDGTLWGWGDNRKTPTKIMDNVKLPSSGPVFDRPSAWAAESVSLAVARGLVPANLRSRYAQPASRADFCALAVTLYEKVTGQAIDDRKTFDDTADANVEKMAAIGVVNGTSPGKFTPGGQITREQAATMLARLADAVGKPFPAAATTFADDGSISGWAHESVGQVQAAGIMNGTSPDKFSPKSPYTREQCIISMLRMYEALE